MTDQTDTPRHAPLAGVIGWPIAHSRSPRLHGHWLARHGIAGHYVPLPVAPETETVTAPADGVLTASS